MRWLPTDTFSVDVTASITNDNSESQPSVLVAADTHAYSSFPWYTPNGPVPFPPFASDVPNNPSFLDGAAGGVFGSTQVPIFYDNNRNGTFEPGVDVPFDSRFVTGGKYINYSTYINDGKSTPSPLFQERQSDRGHRALQAGRARSGQRAAFVGHRGQSELEAR